MANWKTVEEARKTQCCIDPINAREGEALRCIADQCGHWLERPCPDCENGYKYQHFDYDEEQRKAIRIV